MLLMNSPHRRREMIIATSQQKKKIIEQIQGLEFGKFEVKIRKIDKSYKLHKYYRAIIKDISDYTGYTTNEWHLYLKSMYLRETTPVMGKQVETIKSTADLNIKEFLTYIEQVRHYVSLECGYYVLTPEEWLLTNYLA